MLEAMMETILNVVRREVHRHVSTLAHPRAGIVTSYDKATHAVKVKLMPEGNETGWMPLGALHVGNGFGILAGASEGDQLSIGFHEGDLDSPYVHGRHFSDADKPPEVEAGEILVRHKSGTLMNLDKDGQFKVAHAKGGTLLWDKDGKVALDTKNQDVTIDAGTGTMTHKAKSHSYEGALKVKGPIEASGMINGAGGVTSTGRPVRTV